MRYLVRVAAAACLTLCASSARIAAQSTASSSNQKELTWALPYDPKTLDPAKVDDQASELIRYLTGGVLLRLNRSTMTVQPELAETWNLNPDGKVLSLHLRKGLRFSDGSPLTSTDVASTLRRVLSPSTEAPVAEEFIEPAKVTIETPDALTIRMHLPSRLVQVASFLDEIAIEPAHRPGGAEVTAGPFVLAEYHRGEYLRLRRNPFFWAKDASGNQLPYLPSVRIDILGNRDTEELRFLKGQYALLDNVPPDTFANFSKRLPGAMHDLGASLNTEQMWFNQSSNSPLPTFEHQWFTSRIFRSAISQGLRRSDLARIAFGGHATPANGFVSPGNSTWYNRSLPPVHEDASAALKLLASEGFQKRGDQLFDKENHPVKFSLLTNTGNRSRERMAALIQQDLAALGIKVTVVTLDFPALIDRLMHTGDYEAALLGLSNVQPDPSSMMNIWLSDSPNHQWNPKEKTPATAWEAEIDKAMRTQAATSDFRARKAAVDRVQSIVAEQLPFIYLVYPNTLCAVSPALDGVRLSILQPTVVSEIERLHWKDGRP